MSSSKEISDVDMVNSHGITGGDEVLRDLQRYYETGEYSDLTIRAGDKEFKVHKVVVADCLRASGEHEDIGEKTVETIHINHGPEAVEAMIRHLYELKYDKNPDRSYPMEFHFDVYKIADIYDLYMLAEEATVNFKVATTRSWELEDFVSILEYALTCFSPDQNEDILKCLKQVCIEHIDELMKHGEFQGLMQKSGGFSFKILQHFTRHKKYCNSCKLTFHSGIQSKGQSWKVHCPKCQQPVEGK